MNFTINVDMDSFCSDEWFDEAYFKQHMKEVIEDKISQRIMNELGISEYHRGFSYDISKKVEDIIKDNLSIIIERIVSDVTDKCMKKRDIRELCTSDKKNKDYIEELIDAAIKRKFRGE